MNLRGMLIETVERPPLRWAITRVYDTFLNIGTMADTIVAPIATRPMPCSKQ
jgi:hypothetical protein